MTSSKGSHHHTKSSSSEPLRLLTPLTSSALALASALLSWRPFATSLSSCSPRRALLPARRACSVSWMSFHVATSPCSVRMRPSFCCSSSSCCVTWVWSAASCSSRSSICAVCAVVWQVVVGGAVWCRVLTCVCLCGRGRMGLWCGTCKGVSLACLLGVCTSLQAEAGACAAHLAAPAGEVRQQLLLRHSWGPAVPATGGNTECQSVLLCVAGARGVSWLSIYRQHAWFRLPVAHPDAPSKLGLGACRGGALMRIRLLLPPSPLAGSCWCTVRCVMGGADRRYLFHLAYHFCASYHYGERHPARLRCLHGCPA